MKLRTVYMLLKQDNSTLESIIALDLGAKANIALYQWITRVKPLLANAEKALIKELDRFGTKTDTGYTLPRERADEFRLAEESIFEAFDDVDPLPACVLESAQSGDYKGCTAKVLLLLEALSKQEDAE